MDARLFERDIYQGINAYFKHHGIPRTANRKMRIKLVIASIFWPLSLFLLFYFGAESKLIFALLFLLHCFSQLFILLNIAHDANHGSISNNTFLKKILPFSFDLCGVNSYMWRELHHAQHHYCMNVDGEDETLVARNLFRFTKNTEKRFIHRFQHFYFLIFYGLFTADWVFFKDFECFFFPHTEYLRKKKHPVKEYIKLFIFKALYIGYMIVLPILLFGYSFGFVLAIFILCHFVIGLIGGTVIQITHPLSTADYPESKKAYPNFSTFVFATTADYSLNSKIADWFFGGLHLHVIHHLCPDICHTHYRPLTKIIDEVAKKHSVNYRVNPTMMDAITDHYVHLKSLSH